MERPDLRLIASPGRASRPSRVGVALLASYLCGMGLLATLLSADPARLRDDPREEARATMLRYLDGASSDERLRTELLALRDRAARLPLDARARAAYASLLAAVARDQETLDAATFHARMAARLAPVTVPIVRASTLVLAQAGRLDEAVEQVRRMFGFDPNAASRLLAILEPQLTPAALRRALPDAPRAWLARGAMLRGSGRVADAAALAEAGVRRWPESLDLRAMAAAAALSAGDSASLARLLPPDLVLPDEPDSAILLIQRARLAGSADPAAAARDLDRAQALVGPASPLLVLAGDAWLAMDRLDRARELWSRSLHALPADARARRADVLRRLARLDERQGKTGTALRLWREVQDLSAGDAEARRRIADLGGGS